MNNNVNILFYSKECNTCINLLKILHNENLLSCFKLFCVDERLNDIPPQITVVPTMIVSNIGRTLVAQEIFEWITKIKFVRQQQLMNVNKNIIKQNLLKVAQNSTQGPLGYSEQEMSGMSDMFAYKDIDKAQPHNFFGVGEEDKHAIFTAPELSKLSDNEQSTQIKEIENYRNNQDGEFNKLMKQQQIQAVLKSEQEKF